jgi:hypothetical protein
VALARNKQVSLAMVDVMRRLIFGMVKPVALEN